MNNEATKAGSVMPPQAIGSRQRRASESTYGLPNHEDGIQSGDLTGREDDARAAPQDSARVPSGPGDTHSNGMKGQR